MSDALERVRKWDAAVGVDDAVARAVAEERAAVVAWLRDAADTPDSHARSLMLRIVDGLERGEHRREEDK